MDIEPIYGEIEDEETGEVREVLLIGKVIMYCLLQQKCVISVEKWIIQQEKKLANNVVLQ